MCHIYEQNTELIWFYIQILNTEQDITSTNYEARNVFPQNESHVGYWIE